MCRRRPALTEFLVRLADERGRVQEQTHAAATADELRARFTPGRLPRVLGQGEGLCFRWQRKKKVKLDMFLVFNQQFLTLIRAGLPILGSLDLLAGGRRMPTFGRSSRMWRHAGEDRPVDLRGV